MIFCLHRMLVPMRCRLGRSKTRMKEGIVTGNNFGYLFYVILIYKHRIAHCYSPLVRRRNSARDRRPSLVHVLMLSEFHSTSAARRHFYSPAFITNALRLLWVVIVIGGELGVFFWSLSGCRWPSIDLGQVGSHSSLFLMSYTLV
jgi:hypothetical protein